MPGIYYSRIRTNSDHSKRKRATVMGCVYMRTCLTTQMSYIGYTTKTEEKRWKAHCRGRRNRPLTNAIRKYGSENFTVQILEESDDSEYLRIFEEEAIQQLNTKWPNGYNLTDGGDGSKGAKASEATKTKMRQSRNTPEYLENQRKKHLGQKGSMLGRRHTKEAKEKNRRAHLGRKGTPGNRFGAILEEEEVRAIRIEYESKTIGIRKLAKKWRIAYKTAWNIVNRRTWKDV